MWSDGGKSSGNDLSIWLESTIREFCQVSPDNSLMNEKNDRAWDDPLVGFSSGSDPLWQQLKEDIGSFYMTPMEVFKKTFPQLEAPPDQLTVISWILPQTKATKADNRKEVTYPSERWARARCYGEAFNSKLRLYVVERFKDAGFEAIAPLLAPFWSRQVSHQYGIASNWSERHAAYASGLGTFGLCDGLITPFGKAVRCGSVIARVPIEPTVRPYTDHHEYCLHFSRGVCRKCVKRCPAGAITEHGHDKAKCSDYIRQIAREYIKEYFDIETNSCGLCQTGVPCESRIPVKEAV